MAAAWYVTDHKPNASVHGRLEFLDARVIKMVIDCRGIVKKRESKRLHEVFADVPRKGMAEKSQGEKCAKHFTRDEPRMNLPVEGVGEGHSKAPCFCDVWKRMAINDYPWHSFEVKLADVKYTTNNYDFSFAGV